LHQVWELNSKQKGRCDTALKRQEIYVISLPASLYVQVLKGDVPDKNILLWSQFIVSEYLCGFAFKKGASHSIPLWSGGNLKNQDVVKIKLRI
jgi:hypothetical protein